MTDDLARELDAIVPDDQDWTWVLERRCEDCDFDGPAFDHRDVGDVIRAVADRWATVLERPVDELRARRRPDRWTDLEYAAHVRDVFRLYLVRLLLMLREDDPLYPNWDQDESARVERYNELDPAAVAEQLRDAAVELAAAFDSVDGPQWERPGRRSDGASFTVATFARYFVHDPVHHLADVGG